MFQYLTIFLDYLTQLDESKYTFSYHSQLLETLGSIKGSGLGLVSLYFDHGGSPLDSDPAPLTRAPREGQGPSKK